MMCGEAGRPDPNRPGTAYDLGDFNIFVARFWFLLQGTAIRSQPERNAFESLTATRMGGPTGRVLCPFEDAPEGVVNIFCWLRDFFRWLGDIFRWLGDIMVGR